MAKFSVDVKEVWCHTVEVDLLPGATRQQIVDAANQKIAEGDEGATEYDHTLDQDHWNVRNEKGDYL